MSMQVGKIHGDSDIFICVHAGEVKYKEQTFELATGMQGQPIVLHPDGRKFHLSWKDVFNLAIDAFNDDEELSKTKQD